MGDIQSDNERPHWGNLREGKNRSMTKDVSDAPLRPAPPAPPPPRNVSENVGVPPHFIGDFPFPPGTPGAELLSAKTSVKLSNSDLVSNAAYSTITVKDNQYGYFSNIKPNELELLAILSEEMGEAQQIIGKILRHGIHSTHPDDPALTNGNLLEKELGDVECAIQLLTEFTSIVRRSAISEREVEKRKKLQKYLHHTKLD